MFLKLYRTLRIVTSICIAELVVKILHAATKTNE